MEKLFLSTRIGGKMDDKINLQKLSHNQLISLFARTGLLITEDDINQDIAAGLPLNIDGTIDIFVYAAFLVRELNEH